MVSWNPIVSASSKSQFNYSSLHRQTCKDGSNEAKIRYLKTVYNNYFIITSTIKNVTAKFWKYVL